MLRVTVSPTLTVLHRAVWACALRAWCHESSLHQLSANRNHPSLLGHADARNMFNKLTKTGGFLSQLYGATFVHPSRLQRSRIGQETLAIIRDGWERWITADHANNPKYLTPEGRIQHEAASSHAIDHLCEGSAKFAEIERFLRRP